MTIKIEFILREDLENENALLQAMASSGWGSRSAFLTGCLLRGVQIVEERIADLANQYDLCGASDDQLMVRAGQHYGPSADVLVAWLQARKASTSCCAREKEWDNSALRVSTTEHPANVTG